MEKKPFLTEAMAQEIIEDVPTPFHVYDEKGIRENVRRINKAFSWNKGFKEYFAVKALPNPVILQILKEEGCGVLTEDTFVSVAVLKAPIQWDEQHEVQAIFLVSVSRQKNKKLQDFYATTARLLLDEQRIGQLIQKRSYQTLAECLEAVDNERTE